MSSPKQLLPLQQSKLIRLTAEKLISLSLLPVICITGYLHTELQEALEGLNIHFLRNTNHQQGMHTSIQTAIRHVQSDIRCDAVLISLTDQPLIPRSHYQALTTAALTSDNQIIATRYKQTTGVPALFKRSLFEELLQLQSKGGAKQLIAKHHAMTEHILCEAAGLDIDTDEDYRKLLDLFSDDSSLNSNKDYYI